LLPHNHVSFADVSLPIRIICVLLSREPWALKSATNLLFRFVAAIIDSCIKAGDETAWWDNLDINALEIAKGLWDESRMKACPAVAQASQQQVLLDPPQAAPRQDASKLPNKPN